MTKENRENQYKHFRDLEANYKALPGRDHDLEKTSTLRKRAGENANAMLLKNPELDQIVKEKVVVDEEKKEIKSKGKK